MRESVGCPCVFCADGSWLMADVDADAVISVMCYAVRGEGSQWEEECMWKSRVISPHYSHEGQICIHTHTHNRVFPRERQNKRKPCKGDLQRGMSTCAYSHTHTSPSLYTNQSTFFILYSIRPATQPGMHMHEDDFSFRL